MSKSKQELVTELVAELNAQGKKTKEIIQAVVDKGLMATPAGASTYVHNGRKILGLVGIKDEKKSAAPAEKITRVAKINPAAPQPKKSAPQVEVTGDAVSRKAAFIEKVNE